MKKVLILLLLTLTSLFAKVESINEVKLQQLMKEGVVVIDIRRAEEFKQLGVIEGSKRLTFFDEKGNYDANKWLYEFAQYVTSRDQPFVLVCARANRTKVVGNFLSDQLKFQKVYDLEGGITNGWIKKGLPTVK